MPTCDLNVAARLAFGALDDAVLQFCSLFARFWDFVAMVTLEGLCVIIRNGNAAYTRSATFNLDGIVLPPGGFLIVCNDKTTFDSLYSPAICDQQAGSGSVADSDGGDTIGIVDAGDNIIDIFGVPGEIMLSQYVFRDGRAERKQGVTSPSDAWIEEDWTVQTAVNAPEGFDPHTWVGTQQTTLTALAEFVSASIDRSLHSMSCTIWSV